MICDFEIDGKKYSLYFGIVATQIALEKSVGLINESDNIKGFSYIIYGGLCNQADRRDLARPLFEEAYDLTMLILEQPVELQNSIYAKWAETKPAKALIDLLPKSKKKEIEKITGTK